MIIRNLYSARTAVAPDKANSILVVDPDAVLSGSISAQGFQPVAGWDLEIVERLRRIELI